MSFTPSNPRTFPANTSLGIKLTPSNSPYLRTPRSPNKRGCFYESGLSLRKIIGTTVSAPTGFDSLRSGRLFAYVAGAAVVVVHFDQSLKYTQRFFRAHPSAIPAIPINLPSTTPTTPINIANDSRNRSIASLRQSTIGYSPTTPTNSRSEWSDSPLSKTWTSRERIKAATCLSISSDGRFLAVGETGYTPRVLIFSLQESSDVPLVILNEHTFGVTAVSFSPDQRYLATLGSPNDGFLYIWSISPNGAARLHSSNKCTSFIKGMAWMGNSLITVGTRHVKVWRIEDNPQTSPSKQRFTMDGLPFTPPPITVTRTLPGRNCILGSLVDSVFSCVASISNGKALICSDRGDICLLEDNDGQNQLIRVTHAGFGVTCIAVDREHQVIQIGGKAGMTKTMSFDDLLRPTTPPASPAELDFSNSEGQTSVGNLCAMAIIDGRVVAVDSCHAITISETSDSTNFESSPISLTAHRDAVLGVRLISQPNKMAADFFSWDSMGKVLFWDLEGQSKGSLQIELEQCPLNEDEAPNQCLIVRSSVGATFFASGDKYGVLRIIDSSTQNQPFVTKAHNSDIEDIAIYEGKETTYIATAGRDRTVQLFQKVLDSWMLLQTMDEHAGSVGTICFSDDGDKIISSSADRTIQIRQIVSREVNGQNIVAAIPIRVIALKATPVSMVLSTHVPSNSVVVVSLMDRSVCTYEISTGKQTSSFRATDIEGNDAVVMDSLVMGKQGRPTLLAGVSGTDKSVRIYDWRLGMFLDRGFGHTASVTDVALLETPEQTTLISTGSDSTIMIWDLNKSTPELALSADISSDMSNGSPPKEITSAMPPLRRVLSKAELAEFQRPSPSSTPTGRGSPPRVLRRKTSKYSMVAQSSKPPIPPILSMPAYASTSDENGPRRGSPRNRSRSPPPSPKQRSLRRPSLADLRGRTKSTGHTSEFGSLNIATEQTCRTLRAYRKKLSSNEVIREDALKELDQELRLTAQSVLEKTLKTKAISETVLAGLLDQYSERLVSIFDEKLRLSLKPPGSVDTIPEIGIVNPKIRSKSSSRVSTSSSRRTSSN